MPTLHHYFHFCLCHHSLPSLPPLHSATATAINAVLTVYIFIAGGLCHCFLLSLPLSTPPLYQLPHLVASAAAATFFAAPLQYCSYCHCWHPLPLLFIPLMANSTNIVATIHNLHVHINSSHFWSFCK